MRSFAIPLVFSLLWLVAAVGSLMPAMMSVMMFDAPGSEDNTLLWWLVYSIWAFPVLAVVSAFGVWIGWAVARKAERTSVVAAAVLSPAALPLVAVISGAGAITALSVICNGEFRCG